MKTLPTISIDKDAKDKLVQVKKDMAAEGQKGDYSEAIRWLMSKYKSNGYNIEKDSLDVKAV